MLTLVGSYHDGPSRPGPSLGPPGECLTWPPTLAMAMANSDGDQNYGLTATYGTSVAAPRWVAQQSPRLTNTPTSPRPLTSGRSSWPVLLRMQVLKDSGGASPTGGGTSAHTCLVHDDLCHDLSR
jgi:hypothetical protein